MSGQEIDINKAKLIHELSLLSSRGSGIDLSANEAIYKFRQQAEAEKIRKMEIKKEELQKDYEELEKRLQARKESATTETEKRIAIEDIDKEHVVYQYELSKIEYEKSLKALENTSVVTKNERFKTSRELLRTYLAGINSNEDGKTIKQLLYDLTDNLIEETRALLEYQIKELTYRKNKLHCCDRYCKVIYNEIKIRRLRESKKIKLEMINADYKVNMEKLQEIEKAGLRDNNANTMSTASLRESIKQSYNNRLAELDNEIRLEYNENKTGRNYLEIGAYLVEMKKYYEELIETDNIDNKKYAKKLKTIIEEVEILKGKYLGLQDFIKNFQEEKYDKEYLVKSYMKYRLPTPTDSKNAQERIFENSSLKNKIVHSFLQCGILLELNQEDPMKLLDFIINMEYEDKIELQTTDKRR